MAATATIRSVFAEHWRSPNTSPAYMRSAIAQPDRSDRDHLRRVEETLATGRVVALKAYLGYVHAFPSDPGYRPYYELAERFKLPFIFHTGDTYSPYAKLKYAHPLHVDEVAVDYPNVRFVMAHVGNPWMIDAAEVVYKNVNVWVDLSGLFIGSEDELTEPSNPSRNRRDDRTHSRLHFVMPSGRIGSSTAATGRWRRCRSTAISFRKQFRRIGTKTCLREIRGGCLD